MLPSMNTAPAIPDREVCERARHARDARFDGRFFIGVRSTGIYCRPICPAPTAKAANVEYFGTAAGAAEAGFRPCLRCRPETAPGTPAWQGTSAVVARALRLIAEGALDEQSVEALADRLGVTSRHLSRLFREHVGASPVTVAQTRRLQFAKRLIDETALPFADIALAAGFGSLRRFNHAVLSTWGRAPRDLRRLHAVQGPHAGSEVTLRVALREPFDTEHWLDFLARRAIPGVESVTDGSYARTIRTAQGAGSLGIRPQGDHALVSLAGVPPAELFGAVRKARALLDADADPAGIREVLEQDSLLREHVQSRPGIRLPGAWDPFELAVRAVLGQQVTVAAARTLATRLVTRFGEPLAEPFDAALSHLFPRPETLAAADLADLGVPGKRADALRALAAAVADGRVDFSIAPDALREALCALPGIGAWTADYIAMRALRDPDALPAADIVLRKVLGEGRTLSAREVEHRTEAWRPWRAYGLIHVWQAATVAVAANRKE